MINRKDLILIGSIVLIALISMLILRVTVTGGNRVIITIDGEACGSYDLNTDRTIPVETQDGTNLVVIQDGRVSTTQASCPDQICVHTYPLSEENPGVIVCLPHKVIVELKER